MNQIHRCCAVFLILLGISGCAFIRETKDTLHVSLDRPLTPDQEQWQSWNKKTSVCFKSVQYTEASRANQEALALALKNFGTESLEYVQSLRWKGILDCGSQRWDLAKTCFEQHRNILQKNFPKNLKLIAESFLWNAAVSEKLGNAKEAESFRQQAMRLWDSRIIQWPRLAQADFFYKLAEQHRINGMFLVTAPLYRRAAAEYENFIKTIASPETQSPDTLLGWAMAYGNLAWIEHRLGKPAQAISHYEQALQLFQKSSRPDHWKVPEIEMRLSALKRLLETGISSHPT